MSTPDQVSSQVISIETTDGVKLEASLFDAQGPAHSVLLLNSGTGIPRRFYRRFAEHAAVQGFIVLTYDYRGVGGSRPESLKGYRANYRDWGQLDVPAVIDWLVKRYPDHPLCVLGHSTGGQQLGLAHNLGQVQAAAFVGVSTGYWGGMSLGMKLLSLFLWKLYVPLGTRLLGFAPAKLVGLGEDLPSGVALEWGSWCLQPDYLAAYFDDSGRYRSVNGQDFGAQYFAEAKFPIHAWCMTDDPIATRANVPPLLGLYSNTSVKETWVEPAQAGQKHIGHLGFFHGEIGSSLWNEPLDWLRTTLGVNQANSK